MGRWRKKPVIIQAEEATEDQYIDTLEGTLFCKKGDFIITGVENERYSCDRRIFFKTYEPVEESER